MSDTALLVCVLLLLDAALPFVFVLGVMLLLLLVFITMALAGGIAHHRHVAELNQRKRHE